MTLTHPETTTLTAHPGSDPRPDPGSDPGSSPHHPHVEHYRDGGMGGLGPQASVVGYVPTATLLAYRHHDGYWNTAAGPAERTGDPVTDAAVRAHHQAIIDELVADLASGVGFRTPLMLEYDHHDQWAYLGEGNHRLAAALAHGTPHVPVRVVRSPGRPGRMRLDGIGAAATHRPIPGASAGYIPTDIHPAYLGLTH